jgi:NAD(P)-dependent dehydrogenase (short-subunit alcohol dehydrogenase family)
LVSRRRTGLKALQAAIRSFGGCAVTIQADVSDTASAREAMGRVRRAWGVVDLLINNAGAPASAHLFSTDDMDDRMRQSLLGANCMTQAVLPFMVRRKSGAIINVAPPVDGSWGGSLATKFALIGFSETVRSEVRDAGLTVGLVLPDGVPCSENGRRDTSLPSGWVAAATILAVKFRLAEISIPPRASTIEAIRSVTPRAAEAVSGWASAARRLFGRTSDDGDASPRLPGELLRFAVH